MPSFKGYFLEKIIKYTVKRSAKKGMGKQGIEELRQMLNRTGEKLGRLPEKLHVEKVEAEGMYMEWLIPEEADREKVILYFHGGGYGFCSAATHRPLAARIGAAAGVKVLLPEYRLAPEHPFPAAIEDAVRVYRWLLREGYQTSDIIFAGDSAGGGLSLACALVLKEQSEPLPAGLICLSPWVDLTSSGESYQNNEKLDPYLNPEDVQKAAIMYAGGESLDHPLISPVFADLTGLPPLFIQVGSHEILQSDSELLYAHAKLAGVDAALKVWDDMWHVWQISGDFLPEAKQAINEIGTFAKRVFKNINI